MHNQNACSLFCWVIVYNMTNRNACSVKALPNQVRKAGHDYSYKYKECERLMRKIMQISMKRFTK